MVFLKLSYKQKLLIKSLYEEFWEMTALDLHTSIWRKDLERWEKVRWASFVKSLWKLEEVFVLLNGYRPSFWCSRSFGVLPKGKFGLVEVKAPDQKPRKLQASRHKPFERLGFKVYVIGPHWDDWRSVRMKLTLHNYQVVAKDFIIGHPWCSSHPRHGDGEDGLATFVCSKWADVWPIWGY